jgi:hypothetical protein
VLLLSKDKPINTFSRNLTIPSRKVSLSSILVSPEELNMLRMIYFDLALRNGNKKIEKEIFFVFFQKNGLWGHRLFR